MFNKSKKILSTLLCAAMLTSVIGPVGGTKGEGGVAIDALAGATPGAGGVTPVGSDNYEDEPGVPVSDADKLLPYDDDFVDKYHYENEYGFVVMNINPDMLGGGFVNAITHIGINDTKYTYGTVNKDKASWYKLYIPYRYIHEGENDLYFYLEGKTYKVRLNTSSDFVKKNISPVLLSQENVPGKGETIKLNIKYDDSIDIENWYKGVTKENVVVTEIFTAGGMTMVLPEDKYDIVLNKAEKTLAIKFDENYDVSDLNIYKIEVKVPGYIVAYRDVVLYQKPPALEGTWQTDGNQSFRVKVKGQEYSVYLREISKITLIKEHGDKEVLKKGKDYKAELNGIEIFPSAFVSGEKYTLLFSHSSNATARLETTAPVISQTQQVSLVLNDAAKNQDIIFTHENQDWINAITDVTAKNRNGTSYATNWKRSDDKKSIIIPGKSLKDWAEADLWTITITAASFEDVTAYVIVGPPDTMFNKPPVFDLGWKTDGDLAYRIKDKDYYGSYFTDKTVKVLLVDKTANNVKELKRTEDYKLDTYNNFLDVYLEQFTAGHEYEIRLIKSRFSTVTINAGTPPLTAVKTPGEVTIKDILENEDINVISGDPEWLSAVSSVTITDERLFSKKVTDLHKENNKIILPASVINDSNIQKKTGSFTIEISAAGYENYVGQFLVMSGSVTMENSLQDGKVRLQFRDGNFLAYGFTDFLTGVKLNGRTLSPSEYMKAPGGADLYISEKLLEEGEIAITVSSSKSPDRTVTFEYVNTTLQKLKNELRTLIEDSQLAGDLKADYLEQLNHAATGKAVNSLRISVEKAIDNVKNENNNLTVINGSGSGSYEEGVKVPIKAEELKRKKFREWEVTQGDVKIASPSEAGTTVTIGQKKSVVTALYDTAEENIKKIDGIRIKAKPAKTEYCLDEPFIKDGLVVEAYGTASPSNAARSFVLNEDQMKVDASAFDSSTPGKYDITARYQVDIEDAENSGEEFEDSFQVEVMNDRLLETEYYVTEIVIKREPVKKRYEIGDELDVTGLVVTAHRKDAETGERLRDMILDTSNLEAEYNFGTSGKKKVTLSYEAPGNKDRDNRIFRTGFYVTVNKGDHTSSDSDSGSSHRSITVKQGPGGKVQKETRGSWRKHSNGAWAFTGTNGGDVTGWNYVKSGNEYEWYYFSENGAMKTGWHAAEDGKWYYLDTNESKLGTLRKDGWMQDPQDGNWYYLNIEHGGMEVGWQKINGKWYAFNTKTNGFSGWIHDDESGQWTFAQSTGLPLGALLTSTMTPDGYMVDENGAWIE